MKAIWENVTWLLGWISAAIGVGMLTVITIAAFGGGLYIAFELLLRIARLFG